MTQIFRLLAVVLATAMAMIVPAGGAAVAQGSSGSDPGQIVAARLLHGWRTPGGTQMAALHLKLEPGWKTYWRAPGDAGIPPRFDWAESRNLAAVALHWPSPHVFSLNGMQSIGYSDELVLPIELTALVPGEPVLLAADIELGVCRDICVPVRLSLRADPDTPGDAAQNALIRAALAARPLTAAEAGLAAIRCDVVPIADGLRVTAQIAIGTSGGTEVGVIEIADPSVWVATAVTSRADGMLRVQTDLVPPGGQPFLLDRSAVRITILGSERVVDLLGCPGG